MQMADTPTLGISTSALNQVMGNILKTQQSLLTPPTPKEIFDAKPLMGTTIGDINNFGLSSIFNKISLGDLANLYGLYLTSKRLNKEIDALDQNMAIARKNHENLVKQLNNAREKSKLIGHFLSGDDSYKPNYDDSAYQAI